MMDSFTSLVLSEHVGVRLLPRQCGDKKGGGGEIPWWFSGQDCSSVERSKGLIPGGRAKTGHATWRGQK